VEIEFDPAKDAANIAKHGLSLAMVADLDVHGYIPDTRFAEPRFRIYGVIDGNYYCAAGTDRNGRVRVISFRRAHAKEVRRYVR
jgi:uncharacterized protein